MKRQEIKRIRLKLKMTQEVFAAKVGATRKTIFRWETGESVPHKMFVMRIKEIARGR